MNLGIARMSQSAPMKMIEQLLKPRSQHESFYSISTNQELKDALLL